MNVLDAIPRVDFLALVKRSEPSFREHRSHGQMLLWHEPDKASRSQNRALKTCVYDALLFRTAWSIVSQGTSWSGVRLALPGLQMTMRNGLDREDTFAVITLLNERELIVGAGTAEELAALGVIGLPRQMFAMSIPVVVEYMRRRAAEHDITLPKKLAPLPSEQPFWARGNPSWADPSAGKKVIWTPSYTQFSIAVLP